MDIDNSWMPTLLNVINDSIKYKDALRKIDRVRDTEEIEEWMVSIYEFKGYLSEQLKHDSELFERCKKNTWMRPGFR